MTERESEADDEHETHRVKEKVAEEERKRRRKWREPLGLKWARSGVAGGQ